MAKVYVTSIVDAPIEQVWEAVRDFNALPEWHPFVISSHIEDDLPSLMIGCVRNFQLKDSGDTIREQLLALSDVEHSCTYSIVASPLPISNYVATFRLIKITTTNQTFGEWQAAFDVSPAEEANAVELVTSVFVEGFSAISELLTTDSDRC